MEAACEEQKDLDDQQQQKGKSSEFAKHSCEAQKSLLEEQAWRPWIPSTTVWQVVRKRLVMKPYKRP